MSANYKAIADAIDLQGSAFEAFTKRQHERIAEIIDRLEQVEAKGSSPGATRNVRESHEHKGAFVDWMRKPSDPQRQSKLAEVEQKAVTIASNAGGGYAVPEEISREIERLEKQFSPVRDLVKVVKASTSDYKELINLRGTGASWAGESTDRSTPTATPQLREVVPTWGEVYAYPQASNWSLDDIFFDLGAWLAEEVAQEFAIAEGVAVIDGDGSNKPTGMLDTAPVSTADFKSPLRAAAAYRFVPSLSTSSPATAEVLGDALITMLYSLNSAYRARASWAMNSNTAAAIRKLKDGNGNYLWQPGFAAGQPDMLLGYRVSIWEGLDDIATNALPVAFGDFRRGYVLVDHSAGLRITRDEITVPGQTKFYIRRRVAGIVLNNDSIRWLKTTVA